jgi:hypothetical protein
VARDKRPLGLTICACLLIAVGVIAVIDGAFGGGADPSEWVIALIAVGLGLVPHRPSADPHRMKQGTMGGRGGTEIGTLLGAGESVG